MAPTFGEQVLRFNASLSFDAPLPPGVSVMNPFAENACATPACEAFYRKYYNDRKKRHMILGINPGRFGAGITGVPFTDPKRLAECCGISIASCPQAHEPSSQFVYEVVNAMGGPEKFYSGWYINSLCPLGFTREKNGRSTNYNYYDSAALQKSALPFILRTLREQIGFGIFTGACVCFGTGKNAAFLERINAEHRFFGRIEALEHPRYIIQYQYGRRSEYVEKYARLFRKLESEQPRPGAGAGS